MPRRYRSPSPLSDDCSIFEPDVTSEEEDEEEEEEEEREEEIKNNIAQSWSLSHRTKQSAGWGTGTGRVTTTPWDAEYQDQEGDAKRQSYPAKDYNTHADKINESEVVDIDYAPLTKSQMDRVQEDWLKYSTFRKKNPVQMLKRITLGDIYAFMRWRLDQTHGKGGRKLCGWREESSLKLYWKTFVLVYRRETKKRTMDGRICRQMKILLRRLAREYGLSRTGRDKCPMDVRDTTIVLQTTLTTTKKLYKVGRMRIQQIAFQIGGFITANRTKALLSLQYKHIVATILRHPEGGPHRVLLEFTYEFTKTFLGPKAPTTFPIPEILFDPSLILSPHTFYLGMMFKDKVFTVPGARYQLTPENIYTLDIREGCNQLLLPHNPRTDDMYVFRRCVSTPEGYAISSTAQLSDQTARYEMKKGGEITGMKHVAFPKRLRYNGGAAFNKDGSVSDQLQQMIMIHSSMDTFLNYYLPRRVSADVQAIVRGTASQDEMMKAACRMSRWLDPNRPWTLTTEQSSSVNASPQIQSLLRRKDAATTKVESDELSKEIRNTKQRLRRQLLDHIRDNWDKDQAQRDIQFQLAGGKFSDQVKTTLKRSPARTPKHEQLIECILSLPESSLDAESRRRSKAIRAVIDYCDVVEGHSHLVRPESSVQSSPIRSQQETIDHEKKHFEEAVASVYPADRDGRPLYCYECLANPRLPTSMRLFKFSRVCTLSNHFKRFHLDTIKEGDTIRCRLCDWTLKSKMHKQRHALQIHGTVT